MVLWLMFVFLHLLIFGCEEAIDTEYFVGECQLELQILSSSKVMSCDSYMLIVFRQEATWITLLAVSFLLVCFSGSLLPFHLPPISCPQSQYYLLQVSLLVIHFSRHPFLVSVISCSMAYHLKVPFFVFLMILWARNLWSGMSGEQSSLFHFGLTQARGSRVLSLSVWGCNVGCLLGTLVLILVLSPFVVTFLQGLSLHVVSVSCSSVLKHMTSQGSKKVSRNVRPLSLQAWEWHGICHSCHVLLGNANGRWTHGEGKLTLYLMEEWHAHSAVGGILLIMVVGSPLLQPCS